MMNAAPKRRNLEGQGVYFVLNKTDGVGGSAHNMTDVRVVTIDFDGKSPRLLQDWIKNGGLEPTFIVESSPGKHHTYWVTDGEIPISKFRPLLQLMAQRFGGDINACNVTQVLRLPGYIHQKDPARPFQVRITKEAKNDRRYTLADFERTLGCTVPDEPIKVHGSGTSGAGDHGPACRVQDALRGRLLFPQLPGPAAPALRLAARAGADPSMRGHVPAAQSVGTPARRRAGLGWRPQRVSRHGRRHHECLAFPMG
jgi:hypothetical protein